VELCNSSSSVAEAALYGEALYSDLAYCVNCSGAHASRDRNCPVYRDERAIQELRVKEGLSFLDTRMKFFETKPKTRAQSYASTLCRPQGIGSITQREATPLQTKQNPTTRPFRTRVSCQTGVSTHTDHPSNPAVPGARMRLHRGPMHRT
jgi:hypothetical protein